MKRPELLIFLVIAIHLNSTLIEIDELKIVVRRKNTKCDELKSTKFSFFKTRKNSRFSKRDKPADFQNGTKQPTFKTEQNECCYSQYA